MSMALVQPDLAIPSPMVIPAARAEAACREIDGRAILRDLTFDIARGEFVALLGANGAGKSTLLKMLATLIAPTSGRLLVLGERCGPEAVALRARIGLIGHGAMVYRDLSPMENLVFFGRLYRISDPVRRAAELLDRLGLAHRAHDPVKTFSRGMLQRVSIARALMHEPEVLLADEPFAGLDAPSAACLQTTLRQLHAEGRTIILANHDIAQSLELARRVLVLRSGRLVVDERAAATDVPSLLREVSGP
jgi:heme exporter protein A